MQRPKHLFPGQQKDEHVLFIVRKHWLIHFIGIIKLIIFGFLPPTLFLWFSLFFIDNPFDFDGVFSLILFFILFLFAFLIQFSYIEWANDELDIVIVTNKRVIDITQVSFLNRNVAEAPLGHLQDARGETNGFLETLLHYGTLRAATANHKTVFEMDTVANPQDLARKILDAAQHAEELSKKFQPIDISGHINKIRNSSDFFGSMQSVRDRIMNFFQKK